MSHVNRVAYTAAQWRISVGLWSVAPATGYVLGRFGQVLGTVNPKHGYLQLEVYDASRKKVGQVFAHRVVWEYVNGPIPDGMQINHCNGLKTDNRLRNLRLVTPSENMQHAFATGLHNMRGSRNNHSKLTEQDVLDIRAAMAAGEKRAVVAARYGVGERHISGIRNGHTWQHVPMDV